MNYLAEIFAPESVWPKIVVVAFMVCIIALAVWIW
jgi:hypothetical protein